MDDEPGFLAIERDQAWPAEDYLLVAVLLEDAYLQEDSAAVLHMRHDRKPELLQMEVVDVGHEGAVVDDELRFPFPYVFACHARRARHRSLDDRVDVHKHPVVSEALRRIEQGAARDDGRERAEERARPHVEPPRRRARVLDA